MTAAGRRWATRGILGLLLAYSGVHWYVTGIRHALANASGDFLASWPGAYAAAWNPGLYHGSLSERWWTAPVWAYGPLLHLMYLPLTWLPTMDMAYKLFLGLSHAYVVAAFLLLTWHLGAWRRPGALLAWLVIAWANFFPMYESLLQRNIELFELLCVAAGYVWYVRGRDGAAGAALGAGAMAKFLPAMWLAYFIWKRRWRAVAGFCAIVVPLAVATQFTLGWQHNFLFTVFQGTHPFGRHETLNQAVSGLILRAGSALWPSASWPTVAMAASLALGALLLWRLLRSGRPGQEPWEWSLMLVTALLASPRSQPYYYVFLLLPFSFLIHEAVRGRLPAWQRVLGLAAFVLIAWPVPLSVFARLAPAPTGNIQRLMEWLLWWSVPVIGALVLAVVLWQQLGRGAPGPARAQGPSAAPQRGRAKILRIVTRLNIGGPARQVLLLSEALNRDGWETVVVCGPAEASEGDWRSRLDRSVRVIQLPGLQRTLHPLRDLATLWRLVRIVQRERPDLIHTHMAKAGTLGRVAGLTYNGWQRLRRRPGRAVLVHTFHGHVLSGYFGRGSSAFFARVERWLARHTDRLVAISPSVGEDLLAHGIADPARLSVIPLGFDLSDFLAVEAPGQALRRELGVSPTTPLIGIVGRLVPIKQHELFLRAAARLARQDASRRFVIVGGGGRRRPLERMARDLGLSDRLFFLGWRADLPALYADLDCVCLTSRNEGTPVSLIEALAAARPVVATAVGGVGDLLGPVTEHGQEYDVAQRGVLVQLSAQAEGVTAAVERLLNDPDLGRRLADAGRTYVREHYAAARLVGDIAGLYRSLLAAPGTRATAAPLGRPQRVAEEVGIP
jgi:glycosyltransferase involved in cell wall biosynthesis